MSRAPIVVMGINNAVLVDFIRAVALLKVLARLLIEKCTQNKY
jgi:hypothetical protein